MSAAKPFALGLCLVAAAVVGCSQTNFAGKAKTPGDAGSSKKNKSGLTGPDGRNIHDDGGEIADDGGDVTDGVDGPDGGDGGDGGDTDGPGNSTDKGGGAGGDDEGGQDSPNIDSGDGASDDGELETDDDKVSRNKVVSLKCPGEALDGDGRVCLDFKAGVLKLVAAPTDWPPFIKLDCNVKIGKKTQNVIWASGIDGREKQLPGDWSKVTGATAEVVEWSRPQDPGDTAPTLSPVMKNGMACLNFVDGGGNRTGSVTINLDWNLTVD
jgi:hypothetical protein